MGDMTGKVVIVTGATAGIGLSTAKAIAKMGATVVIVGRNLQKTEGVVNDLKQETGNQNIDFIIADLSSQADIHRMAEAFKATYDRLDVLVNNAGAMMMSRQETVDGLEMSFALNHLGYFLPTLLLLDVMKASTPARIVNVSSALHSGRSLDFDDLQMKANYSGMGAYGASKLMNVYFTYELARRLAGTDITVNALHPGLVASNFALTNNTGFLRRIVRFAMNLISISNEDGAKTSVYLATSPEVEGVTGKYFEKSQEKRSSEESHNEADAKRLWEISEEITGVSL